jgi:hypothetical protein
MDRRAILLALAAAGELTPERALVVRAGAETLVLSEIARWGVSAALDVAGIAVVPGRGDISDEDAQAAVDMHLALLGLEPVPVRWTSRVGASTAQHDPTWARAAELAGDPTVGMALGYDGWPARIMMATDDAWVPLHKLLRAGILPYGLDARGFFLLVRG